MGRPVTSMKSRVLHHLKQGKNSRPRIRAQEMTPGEHSMKNFEVIWSTEIHVLVSHRGEFLWGTGRGVLHSYLRQLIQTGQQGVTVGASPCSITKVEVHVPSDLVDFRRSQFPCTRYHKHLGSAA